MILSNQKKKKSVYRYLMLWNQVLKTVAVNKRQQPRMVILDFIMPNWIAVFFQIYETMVEHEEHKKITVSKTR